MKKILILHGLGGSSKENWFPWAKLKLEKKGMKVIVPDLPNAMNPDSDDWNASIKKLIKNDEEITVIGHSLGGTAIYKLCEDNKIKIKEAIIIAAPFNDLGWDNLKLFFTGIKDYSVCNIEKCTLMYSDNDPYVPLNHAEEFKKRIQGSEILIYRKIGHFNFEGPFLDLLKILQK